MRIQGRRVVRAFVLAMIMFGGSILSPGANGQGEPSRPLPRRIEASAIENLYQVGPTLFSGGEPRGDAGFSALRAMGIRTVISVDGSMPDVEAARKQGLRYVHLPVGYDGIPREQGLRIIKAFETLPGPIFIHCHHGKHRGPTAVALCGMSAEGWSKAEATSWLKRAGASPDYAGLYATVANFAVPTPKELERLVHEFPERCQPPALVELMVSIDGRWDTLKAIREAGYRPNATHPDLDPPHEALQLAESFREVARGAVAGADSPGLKASSETSAKLAKDLEASLRAFAASPSPAVKENVDRAFDAVGKSCTACHARHRDRKD